MYKILIKNIYETPLEDDFKVFIVNYKSKIVEKEYQLKTNNTNCIEIDKKLIKPEMFLFSKEYLGIPMYVSLKNNFLSVEHTHPPHSYILSDNRFIKVSSLKSEINEIVN